VWIANDNTNEVISNKDLSKVIKLNSKDQVSDTN